MGPPNLKNITTGVAAEPSTIAHPLNPVDVQEITEVHSPTIDSNTDLGQKFHDLFWKSTTKGLCPLLFSLDRNPSIVIGEEYREPDYVYSPEEFGKQKSALSWEFLKAVTIRLSDEFSNGGTGFLISDQGHFITTFHGLEQCLKGQLNRAKFSNEKFCDGYKARIGEQEYDFSILSHLDLESAEGKEDNATAEKVLQRHRDFVIGQLHLPAGVKTSFVSLASMDRGINDISGDQSVDLAPFCPPIKVFVPGFPDTTRNFYGEQMAVGIAYLTHAETGGRGYTYSPISIGQSQFLRMNGNQIDTSFHHGSRLVGGSSGSPVFGEDGRLYGILVTGNGTSGTILSVTNILRTFFQSEKTDSDLKIEAPYIDSNMRCGDCETIPVKGLYLRKDVHFLRPHPKKK